MGSTTSNFQLLIAMVVWSLAAANALAQPVVQKSESSIDEKGCLHFEATARVEQPIDDLYGAMSRPEALYFHTPMEETPKVFVGFPWSKESILYNLADSWSATTHPFSKILEFEAVLGASVGPDGPPRWWVEYRFNSKAHIIWVENIGSTWGINNPRFNATYFLSPTDNKSATSTKYVSRRCWPPEGRKMLANEKREQTEREKDLLIMWLTAANAECDQVRAEPSPVASTIATPTASPGGVPIPTDTATPIILR
jgi:hypothetical protein